MLHLKSIFYLTTTQANLASLQQPKEMHIT